jgi:tetratricopeptide (TPR) repeat protein
MIRCFHTLGTTEENLIQVIPFSATACEGPAFLPLLARGLSDLAVLRFQSVLLEAQLNPGLKPPQPDDSADIPTTVTTGTVPKNAAGREFWFSGSFQPSQQLSFSMLLYDPQERRVLHRESFSAGEEDFLLLWEEHLEEFFVQLGITVENEERKVSTHSLPAFLAFRRGLEIIAQSGRESRKRSEGIEALLEAVAYDSQFTEAADLVVLFLMQDEAPQPPEGIIASLERLSELQPGEPRFQMVLGEAYRRYGSMAKTEEVFAALLKTHPTFLDGWIHLALHYYMEGDSAQATATLERIPAEFAGETVVLDLLGAIYAASGERSKAEKLWQQALELEPGRTNILNNLGLLYEEEEKYPKAQQYLVQSIAAAPDWWASFFNYGSFCRRRGRAAEAVLWLERAAQLNPGHCPIIYQLALAQLDTEDYSPAQANLLKALGMATDNELRREILQLLDGFDSPEVRTALRLRKLEEAWSVRPGDWRVLLNLLTLLLPAWRSWSFWQLAGNVAAHYLNPTPALILWRRGLRYEPGFSLLKKVALAECGRRCFKQALPELRRAFGLNQSDSEVAAAYLEALVQTGELRELQEMKEALTHAREGFATVWPPSVSGSLS